MVGTGLRGRNFFCSSRKQESTWPSKTGQATWRKEQGAAPPAARGCWGDEEEEDRCAEMGEGLTGDLGGGAFGSVPGAS